MSEGKHPTYLNRFSNPETLIVVAAGNDGIEVSSISTTIAA